MILPSSHPSLPTFLYISLSLSLSLSFPLSLYLFFFRSLSLSLALSLSPRLSCVCCVKLNKCSWQEVLQSIYFFYKCSSLRLAEAFNTVVDCCKFYCESQKCVLMSMISFYQYQHCHCVSKSMYTLFENDS